MATADSWLQYTISRIGMLYFEMAFASSRAR
jgi:hypothetical protein